MNPDDATIAALAEALENVLSPSPTVSERLLQEKSVADVMPGDLAYVHSDRDAEAKWLARIAVAHEALAAR